MAMLEIDKSLLYEPTGGGLKALGLDRQKSLELRSLPRKSELAMKGYPLERGQIDYALQTLTNRAYHVHAFYDRADSRIGLHWAGYPEESRPVKDHSGMSGSPWIVSVCEESDWKFALAAIHLEGIQSGGQEQVGIFVGADILIGMLTEATK